MGKGVITVGVLGGIGPESTAEYYTKLVTRFQEKGLIKRNKDFPQIVINSIPAPELIFEKITDADLRMYADGLKQLDEFGVDFIVMVCNTIHLFYDRLQSGVKTPILDLRAEVRKVLEGKKATSVLVLGTPSTIENGLYEFNDTVKTVKPTAEEAKALSEAILNFNNGVDKEALGSSNLNKINTIDVLVEATIAKVKELRQA